MCVVQAQNTSVREVHELVTFPLTGTEYLLERTGTRWEEDFGSWSKGTRFVEKHSCEVHRAERWG